MISQEIKAVASTQLFCGVNKEKTKQITIYANTINNVIKNNVMILPVPFPTSVIFHNLEKYKDFFSDCKNSFYDATSSKYLSSNSYGVEYKCESMLKVYDIGSYKVSLAHSLDDLKRVDNSVFELSKGLDQMLKKYYSNPIFGFIICKLAEGNEKYHPFAYSHNITDGKVFIPTRHYHDNTNLIYNNYDMFSNKSYTNNNINNSPMFSSWTSISNSNLNSNSYLSNNVHNTHDNSDLADDWDHDIYLYNIDLGSNVKIKKMNTCNEIWKEKVYINLNKLDFALDRDCRIFNKLEINGHNPNIDIVLSIY